MNDQRSDGPATLLTTAVDSALRAVDRALEEDMRTADDESAAAQLEDLRDQLLAIRAREAVSADELRTMIRTVAKWAPEDDVTLLAALGAITRSR
jgi:hypothetical protein